MMQHLEFVKLVREMREAQKSFFRGRLQTDLQRSKQLERQVDSELAKYITDGNSIVTQPELFQ